MGREALDVAVCQRDRDGACAVGHDIEEHRAARAAAAEGVGCLPEQPASLDVGEVAVADALGRLWGGAGDERPIEARLRGSRGEQDAERTVDRDIAADRDAAAWTWRGRILVRLGGRRWA